MSSFLKMFSVGTALSVGLVAALAEGTPTPKSVATNAPPASVSAAAQAGLPGTPAGWLVGTWRLDVRETADVLARAQFGTNAVITIKHGAPRPETNLVHKPFDEATYAKSKATWENGLAAMDWQLRFNPDHSGEGITRDFTNGVLSSSFTWQRVDQAVQIEYLKEKIHRHSSIRIVSTNELHCPMPALGGHFVLRPSP